MARKRDVAIVATSAERSRAARLRKKQRQGKRLKRADYDWLRRYDAERRRNKALRKKSSKRPRAATKKEKAEADRLRKREHRRKNNPLTPEEREILREYRKKRKQFKKYQSRVSNKDSAHELLLALATWTQGGDSIGIEISDSPDSYGGFEARFPATAVLGDDTKPIPGIPKSEGKYASIAVEYELAPEDDTEESPDEDFVMVRRRQWAICVAATDNWSELAADFQIEIVKILDDYFGRGITAISALVRDPKEPR